jgi:hypothetical protein
VSIAQVNSQNLTDVLISDLNHDCIEIAPWKLVGIGKERAKSVTNGLFASAQQVDDVRMDCGERINHPPI